MALSYRCKIIADLLKQENFVSISELCTLLNVTSETVRRDLLQLEKAGLIERIRGGAIIKGGTEVEVLLRKDRPATKGSFSLVAELAAELVRSKMTIMLDSSQSAKELLRFVSKRVQLTVITNCPEIITRYGSRTNTKFICTGGEYSAESGSFTGSDCISTVHHYNADIAFIGCAGASTGHGYTDLNAADSEVKCAMSDQSKETIMLMPHEQFDKVEQVNSLQLNEIATLITDTVPSAEWLRVIDEEGLGVIYPTEEDAAEESAE